MRRSAWEHWYDDGKVGEVVGGTVGGADGNVAVRVCVRTRMSDTRRGGRGCGRDRVCGRTYMCMRACVHGYGAAASLLPHLGARMFSLLIYRFSRLLSTFAAAASPFSPTWLPTS